MKSINFLITLSVFSIVAFSNASASDKNERAAIGKGNLVSKRMALTYAHGRIRTHAARIAAIKAKHNK